MSYFKDEKSEYKLNEFNKRIEDLNEKIPGENLRFSTLLTFPDGNLSLKTFLMCLEITDLLR